MDARAELRRRLRTQMLIGLVVAAVGAVITVATYHAAANGGHYVVAWGAIVFGGLRAATAGVRLVTLRCRREIVAEPAPALASGAVRWPGQVREAPGGR